jgi:formylmethanofuran dehydrogenase subunit C
MDITGDSLLSLDERHPVHAACPRWFGAGSRDGAIPAGCTRRWPVVHAQHAGTVQLEGSSAAQGVLLVDGDLRIGAGVRFHGLLLVRGRVTLEGASTADAPMVAGAVVVRDAAMAGSRLGYARLQASQCAVRLALAGAGRAVPVRRYGWSERP